MDDFTKNMLERAKMRRQKLNNHMIEAGKSRPTMPLQENNTINIDNGVTNYPEKTAELPSALSTTGKSKLQQLGHMYGDDGSALSSPIHRAEDKILAEASKSSSQVKCRLGRLNELASTINQWEDDLSHPDLKRKPEAPKPPVTKFTKTETTLTESSVSTTITMTTINKGAGADKVNKTTATIIANGTKGEDVNTRKKKVEADMENIENEGEEKMPRLTGVRCNANRGVSPKNQTTKQMQWDEAIQKTLESQGFSASDEPKAVYNFEAKKTLSAKKASQVKSPRTSGTFRKSQASPAKGKNQTGSFKKTPAPAPPSGTYKKDTAPLPPSGKYKKAVAPAPPTVPFMKTSPSKAHALNRLTPSPTKSPKMGVSALDKESSVLKRAAMFESQQSSPVKSKDPAELTLAERKALFERNKGEILLPKVAFATPLPAKLRTSPLKPMKKEFISIACPVSHPEPAKNSAINSLKNRFEQDLVETTNANMSKLEKEKDMEFLKNRWNRNKAVSGYAEETAGPAPPPPPMPTPLSPPAVITPIKSTPLAKNVTPEPYKDSPEALRVLQGVKPIILSPPKKGKLYPCLSDIEMGDESETSSSPSSLNHSKNSNIYLNMSFGDILEASKNNPMTPPRETREAAVLNEMDELLDAALGDVSSSDEDGPTPPKLTRAAESSTSFEYERGTPRKPSVSTTPLVHTVSFYRKQQNCLSTPDHTPMRQIKRNEVIHRDEPADESAAVQQKMNELMAEVGKQQTYISQASNALSVCLANIEFANSGEQVEGERLLLLASHKRQACLHEVERLKVEGSLRALGSNSDQLREQGDIIISGITIPLKRDALRAMATDENMQYFVCLIKSDERVVATPVVSATGQNMQGTTLTVPGEVRLEKLHSDFKVTVEVYHMVLNREMLPYHIKYHLPGKKDKRLLTPSKSKKSQSRLIMPSIQSPAGPNAVRTTNFQMCGYVVFSLRELKRVQWTLNKVPYTSPLEGSLSMQIASSLQMDAEHRGFLAMFDDVSGLGAWHRRWCMLSAHTLSYWKYPDDENKKVPLGSVDLRTVVTDTVGLVSRDICARLNTFLIETTRPREAHDMDSLVLVLDGDVARIRHLLSADTKEERIEWCARLNKALALIRAWNCQV